jgi:hypothetical protein
VRDDLGARREAAQLVDGRPARGLVVRDQDMAHAGEDARPEPVQPAVDHLVREHLVDRPDDPVAEQPGEGQPRGQEGELHVGERAAQALRAAFMPPVGLRPVEVQHRDPAAAAPEPAGPEARAVHHAQAERLDVLVEQPLVGVGRQDPGKGGEAVAGRHARR